MKRLFTTLAILLLSASAWAQEPHLYPANQKSIAWDAAENATEYIVYTEDLATGTVTEIGRTAALSFPINFTTDAKVIMGVRSIRTETVNGETTTILSVETAWSDNAADVLNGETFGFYYFVPPGKAKNLAK